MSDRLSQEYIQNNTPDFYHCIQLADCVQSTNDEVKKLAARRQEGCVLISDGQTGGKGRNGKNFYSRQGKGIYMSLLLKPDMDLGHSLLLTACIALAVVQAIEKNCGIRGSIKWVNDIFIEDRKIAGILCESALKPGTSQLEYMVIGIGINTHSTDFPPDIAGTAASIEDFTMPPQRNRLICDFLNIFYSYYKDFDSSDFMDCYRRYSNLINQEITVYENNTCYPAIATAIDDMGRLVVKTADGRKKLLASAEITIRKKQAE